MTNEDKQLKRSIISRIVVITVIGVMLGLLVVSTFGWFALTDKLSSTGMGVVVRKKDYDIIIQRGQYADEDEFDRVDEEGSYIYDLIHDHTSVDPETGEEVVVTGGLKSHLLDDNYDLSEFTTVNAANGKVAFEMLNEYQADGKYYLRPGAYGTVTFYIRPKTLPLAASFIFECSGYEKVYNTTDDKEELREVTESVENLLRGHILFFTHRSGADYEHYKYTGLLQDEAGDGVFKFDFDTSDSDTYVGEPQSVTVGGNTYDNCYKIVLYWEWPITYDEMLLNLSTNEETKKYPSELADFYNENPEYFFIDIDETAGKTQEELSMAYNNGDQNIGAGSDFLVIYLTAS